MERFERGEIHSLRHADPFRVDLFGGYIGGQIEGLRATTGESHRLGIFINQRPVDQRWSIMETRVWVAAGAAFDDRREGKRPLRGGGWETVNRTNYANKR